MSLHTVLRATVLLVLTTSILVQSCPTGCQCSTGQLYMSCKELNDIPPTIPGNITEVFFDNCYLAGELSKFPPSYNKVEMISIRNSGVTSLSIGAFENTPAVHTLDLMGNRLEHVDAVALKGLDKLKFLDLKANKIESIDDDTFQFNPLLEELNLNNNHEIKLTSRSFAQEDKDKNQLQKVELSNCGLTTVPISAVCPSKVPKLVFLDLSKNNFTNLDEFLFKHAPHLTFLNMDSCKISEIKRETLGAMKNLETLYLSNNNIESIDEQAFDDFYSTLKYVHLERNKLTKVSHVLFNFKELKVLNVSHNPWDCSCENSWIQNFPAMPNNTAYNITCNSPDKYQNQNALEVMKSKVNKCSSGPNPMVAVYVAIPILIILTVVTIIIIVKICKLKRREKSNRNAQYSLVYKPTTEKA